MGESDELYLLQVEHRERRPELREHCSRAQEDLGKSRFQLIVPKVDGRQENRVSNQTISFAERFENYFEKGTKREIWWSVKRRKPGKKYYHKFIPFSIFYYPDLFHCFHLKAQPLLADCPTVIVLVDGWTVDRSYVIIMSPSLSQPVKQCLLRNDHRGPRLAEYEQCICSATQLILIHNCRYGGRCNYVEPSQSAISSYLWKVLGRYEKSKRHAV